MTNAVLQDSFVTSLQTNFRLHVQEFAHCNQNQLSASETIRCFINSLNTWAGEKNGMPVAQQLQQQEIHSAAAELISVWP